MTWLNNFSVKLNGYATRLDISPETLNLVDTDAKTLTTLINYAETIGQYK